MPDRQIYTKQYEGSIEDYTSQLLQVMDQKEREQPKCTDSHQAPLILMPFLFTLTTLLAMLMRSRQDFAQSSSKAKTMSSNDSVCSAASSFESESFN